MTIDTSRLDGIDALQGHDVPLSLLVAWSQAVSLKRIADLLEAREAPIDRLETQTPLSPDLMIRVGEALQRNEATMREDFARWEGGPASGSMADTSTAGVEPVINTPAVLPAGFTPFDPDSSPVADPATGSPVDRNSQIRVAFANGRKLKMFAGSAQWRAKADDPFRPIGYQLLGDGSTVSAEDKG